MRLSGPIRIRNDGSNRSRFIRYIALANGMGVNYGIRDLRVARRARMEGEKSRLGEPAHLLPAFRPTCWGGSTAQVEAQPRGQRVAT
jgi:hypothetical protein